MKPKDQASPRDTGDEALSSALKISFRLLRVVMIVVVVAYLFSGVRIVRQQEKGFVLVFGKIAGLGADRVKGPGFHWILPRPFAELETVETERVQTVLSKTFWYKETAQPGLPPAPPGAPPNPPAPVNPRLSPGVDGYTLTGDANILHSQWALRYTIALPERYRYRLTDPQQLLQCELDHAVLKISSRFPVDAALRTEIEAFRAAVDAEVRQRCEDLGLGIQIERVDILGLSPPRQVAEAFAAVIAAEQDRSSRITDARTYAARTLNEAGGEAARIQADGEAYRRRVVSQVSADADYFAKVHEQYVKNPDVIAQTLLQDTLRRSLANVQEKFILGSTQAGQQELRLLINPEPQPLPAPKR